jgi:hypothetical protein
VAYRQEDIGKGLNGFTVTDEKGEMSRSLLKFSKRSLLCESYAASAI